MQDHLLPSPTHLTAEWDTHGDKIHWDTAITLGEMSALAYTVPHNRELVLRLLGFDEIVILDDGPRSGFVALTDEAAVVAFRGTDDLQDWLANLDCLNRTPVDAGRELHSGFWAAYDCLAGQIKQKLTQRSPTRVWITGHSLGGAMAACCGFDFLRCSVPFTGLVTFGQPRVGNRELAQFLNDEIGNRYMRFVNEGDVFPLAPPGLGIKLPDYWHCGSRVHFKDGEMKRWNGLAVFSASGPEDEVGTTEPTGEIGNDGEQSLTEEQFSNLQEQLRKSKQTKSLEFEAQPTELTDYSGDPPLTSSSGSSFGGWIDGAIGSIKQRIEDHYMVEYLTQLNDFAKKDS